MAPSYCSRVLTQHLLHAILMVAAGCMAAAPVFAQAPPPAVKKRLLEQGFDYRGGPDIYADALAAAPTGGVKVIKNQAYGSHLRQQLDVYQPAAATNAPILVFVHGGGYTGGARENAGNVLAYFARHGFVGINVEYRLAPEFSWPAGADDVRGAVAWIKKHGKGYGGNTDRIFLFGHSAGASHVAGYVFDRRLQPDTGHGVAGAILSSGRYTLSHDPDDPSLTGGVMQYFGADPLRYASRSITTHVATSRIPVMLVVSEFDQRNLVATSGELFVELCKRDGGRCPRFVQLKYHNHLSSVRHFNTEDDYLGREILEWVSEGADRANAQVDPR